MSESAKINQGEIRMRNKIVIMVIAALALLSIAGGATATCVQDADTICLTNTNNNDLTGIVVKVVITGTEMVVQLDNNPVSNTALGIDKYYYNSNAAISAIYLGPTLVSSDWNNNGNSVQADGFGTFESGRWADSAGLGGISLPLKFIVASNPVFETNPPEMAVHIRFDKCSGWISNREHTGTNNDDTTYGCTPTQIPEFPTIALPIAAVIGLMFIFQQRKK